MLSESFSRINKYVYTYLGYKNIGNVYDLDNDIDSCLFEIEKISQFKYIYVEFTKLLPFLNQDAYIKLLKDASSYYFILTTLGAKIDERIKYYSKFDMKKGLIFDACASAYLEYMADNYEDQNFIKPHTFRFCPGYGGTKTDDLREIFKYIDNEKIGVTLLDSNLMIPQKSMCGIIGVGIESKKECGKCLIFDKCEFRKRNTVCYKKN